MKPTEQVTEQQSLYKPRMMLLAGANESYRGALLGRKMQIVTRKLNIMRPSFNLITALMPQIIVSCAFSFSSEGKPIVCEVSSMGKNIVFRPSRYSKWRHGA